MKKKSVTLEYTINQLRAEVQRFERENIKQQTVYDKLLETTQNFNLGKNGITTETRKDVEKTFIVRQLKKTIHELRDIIINKDAEIDNLNKSQKSSNILVITYERDEYYNEIQRLQKVMKELKDELNSEKQRREWNVSLKNTAEIDIKREVAKLAADYNNILSTIVSGQKLNPNGQLNTIDNNNILGDKASRPSSAVRSRKNKTPAVSTESQPQFQVEEPIVSPLII